MKINYIFIYLFIYNVVFIKYSNQIQIQITGIWKCVTKTPTTNIPTTYIPTTYIPTTYQPSNCTANFTFSLTAVVLTLSTVTLTVAPTTCKIKVGATITTESFPIGSTSLGGGLISLDTQINFMCTSLNPEAVGSHISLTFGGVLVIVTGTDSSNFVCT